MNTWKTCKWWGEGPRDWTFPDVRSCGWESQRIDMSDTIYPYYLDDLGEQDANFETGPDFGCIHWEEKK